MSYLKHKKGSLEEAVLEAVSKDVKEYVQADGTKRRVKEGDNRLKSNKLKIEDNTNDKSDDGEGLDKVQPDAVKKKFKDRKDKDIDNDGDVDDSDEYLHKRRQAISKAVKETKQEIDTKPTIRLADLASNIVGNQAIGGLSKKNS